MAVVGSWESSFAALDGLRLTNDGAQAYGLGTNLSGTATLAQFDMLTGAVLKSFTLPGTDNDPAGPLLAPDYSTLYVEAGGILYGIDPTSFAVFKSAPAAELLKISLSPDGRYIYGTGFTSDPIYDASTFTLVNMFPAGSGNPFFIGK